MARRAVYLIREGVGGAEMMKTLARPILLKFQEEAWDARADSDRHSDNHCRR